MHLINQDKKNKTFTIKLTVMKKSILIAAFVVAGVSFSFAGKGLCWKAYGWDDETKNAEIKKAR